MNNEMLVLGFESSCDETGVALVQWRGSDLPVLLGQALHSQIEMHQAYGGVVPELASRDHIRRILPLTVQALAASGRELAEVDVVAFTQGPGLAGALLVSGGHTQLMRVDGVGCYAILGETIDDAAGEAFDKSAKLLGLPYPGGPGLARLAEHGNPAAFNLPRPLLKSGNLDFSFAGLKTAVMVQVKKLSAVRAEPVEAWPPQLLADLAASTQAAIVEVLVKKALSALRETGLDRLVVAGGVGANRELRQQLDVACGKLGVRVHYPEMSLCTDNGAMIAMAAAMRLQSGQQAPSETYAFDVKPRWSLAALSVS